MQVVFGNTQESETARENSHYLVYLDVSQEQSCKIILDARITMLLQYRRNRVVAKGERIGCAKEAM